MTSPVHMMVRTYAIGSLLPLSSSSIGRILPLRASFLDLRTEKTEAESVEETIEPSRRDSENERLVIIHTNVPTDRAVIITPTVDSAIPCQSTGFTYFQSVSRPPENKIQQRAITPMNWAVLGFEKRIPPIPSEPANIPKTMKSMIIGTPKRLDVLPAISEMKRSIDPISNIL